MSYRYTHLIEIKLNVMLNHNQQTTKGTESSKVKR